MRGKTHFTIGILASLQASIIFNKPISLMNIGICSLFSILPDLDTSNSVISNTILNHNTSKKIYKIIVYTLDILIFFNIFKNKWKFFHKFSYNIYINNSIRI